MPFNAIRFARTFAMPDGTGGVSTSDSLYVIRPAGYYFHPSVIRPWNQTVTALALDQLRLLLRLLLCALLNPQNIDEGFDEVTFDRYIQRTKDAFTALGQDTTRIDEIRKLSEEAFPPERIQKLKDKLKREKSAAIKFKQVDDHPNKIEFELTILKRKLEDVESGVKYVKTGFTDVMTSMEVIVSEMKALKADIAMQAESSKGPLFPYSCMPDKIPYFVGRQEESQAILDHLTAGDTRLVDVWGPPGFGKTSVAINVAHQLREMEIPAYLISLRGMKSKDELVSKLLSIFAVAKQMSHPHISATDWLIHCLKRPQNRYVLILDNADDLLESGDAKLKGEVLRFTEEILTQCSYIKLLFTTRESLDYLSHKLPIHQERVGVLDEVSSVSLVQSLLPDVSNEDCSSIVKLCGQVPLAMRLMCSIMREENTSLNELLEELKSLSLVEVLDNASFCDDVRLKRIIDKSFQRLTDHEKRALVSLAVFPGRFRIADATTVLHLKTDRATKKILRSLERKSLIESRVEDSESSFTVHSLLRAFVDEKKRTDQGIGASFHAAQLRFYIKCFTKAIKKFLTGHLFGAFIASWKKSPLASLFNDKLYRKVVEVLSKAELFLSAIWPGKESLFEKRYDTAVKEEKKRQNMADKGRLLTSKSFHQIAWFSIGRQSWNSSLYGRNTDAADCPVKLQCYHGIHQILCGYVDEGISSLSSSVDRLSSKGEFNVELQRKATETLAALSSGNEESEPIKLVHNEEKFSINLLDLLNRLPKEPEVIPEPLTRVLGTLLAQLSLDSGIRARCYDKRDTYQRVRKDYNRALESHQHAIRLREENIDGVHVDTAESQTKIGCAYFEMNNESEAIPVLQSVLELGKRLGVCEHRDTAKIYYTLSRYHSSLSNYAKSIEAHLQASRFTEKQPGENLLTAQGLNTTGCVYHEMGDFQSAREVFHNALYITKKLLGEHEISAHVCHNLAYICLTMGSPLEALELCQEALSMRLNLLSEHVDTARSSHLLGVIHFKMGDYPSAFEVFQTAAEMRSNLLGDHEDTALTYLWLAQVQLFNCRTHRARGCRQQECLQFWSDSELCNIPQAVICREPVDAVETRVPVRKFAPSFILPNKKQTTHEGEGRPLPVVKVHEEKIGEEQALALPFADQDALLSQLCDSQDVAVRLQEDLQLEQASLVNPDPDTKEMETSKGQVLTLSSAVQVALLSQSCDAKEVVRRLKGELQLEQSSLEHPEPETQKIIRCLARKAKCSSRLDVVEHLREVTPAGTTGPLLCENLDVQNIPLQQTRKLSVHLCGGDEWMMVAERLGLTQAEIRFLDRRCRNPFEEALIHCRNQQYLNVGQLYDVLVDCEFPIFADFL